MKVNMGRTDKTIRILIATVLVALYLTDVITGVAGYFVLAVVAIFSITSMLSFCPLYKVFGINTCPQQ